MNNTANTYFEAKRKNRGYIVFVLYEREYLTFYEDAEVINEIFGIPMFGYDCGGKERLITVKIKESEFADRLAELKKRCYGVVIKQCQD